MSLEEQIQKEINKKYGDGVMLDASFLLEQEKKIIPISPAADISMSGGVQEGTVLILSGPPKCGKTTLALQIAANAQQLYNRYVYYFNVESRVGKKNLQGVHNFDVNKCKIIQSAKGNILTAETILNEAMYVIKNHEESIIIMDSTSSLCSEKEMTDDITAQTRNNGPKLLASFFRQMCSPISVQNVLFIAIQHIITNTSGYGSKYMEDGGLKIQFQMSSKLRCKRTDPWLDDKKKQIGQIIDWQVVESVLGKPNQSFQGYLKYGYGIDKNMELFSLGKDIGLIEGGTWYSFTFLSLEDEELKPVIDKLIENGKDIDKPESFFKFHGAHKAYNFLEENPIISKILEQKIKELLL